MKAKIIECEEYEIVLNDGTRYKITCSDKELDKLIILIGEDNICEVVE